MFDNHTQPPIFLCNTDKTIIGELPAYSVDMSAKWNQYSELTFTINRKYTDILTGEQRIHPLFDKVEGLRKVYVYGMGYFIIQDPDITYSEEESKTVQCFSSEYENGNKYLESFFINTGETDSAEIIYLESKHGEGYSLNELYTINTDDYDPYRYYYVKTYDSDGKSSTFEKVTVDNKSVFDTYDGTSVIKTLYVQKHEPVRFYWETRPELSLLNIIFKKVPCWKIGHVDASLCNKEYRFEEERIAVYDFMMNEMSETVGCVVEWDTIKNEVNFYATEEDGLTEENSVQTLFDTDIFISRENLATEIKVSYSTDDIKTKLRVIGGSDDMDIRYVNLGQNYIINLDYYNTVEWMGEDLYTAWNEYTALLEEKTGEYQTALDNWTKAYNAYDKLMNNVPATNDVLLVGDEFKRLYCIYSPEDDSEAALNASLYALKKKLQLYYTTEDPVTLDKNDNILLTLKDANENSAKIRVKYENGTHTIRLNKHNSAQGLDETQQIFGLDEWVKGKLTADHARINLQHYKIASIGTLGAYLCLAKDEAKEENLQEYGIYLLTEKRDTYLKIFNTQTGGLFSSEKNQCLVQDDQPTGDVLDGTFWLDSDDDSLTFYHYTSTKGWQIVNTDEDLASCQNYVRFIGNYEKLQAVQNVLAEKTEQATYYLNGFLVDGFYLNRENVTEFTLQTAAESHFADKSVTRVAYDDELKIYTFTINDDKQAYMAYVQNSRPYVSYANSVGVSQCHMDYLKSATDMENYFSPEQWARLSPLIREDEYSNDNIAFVGNESEVQSLELRQELLKEAQKELKKLCQPSLNFNMSMANILAIPEFKPLLSRFQLGNYIKVGLRPGYMQRARLLEVSFSLSDFSDFSATFGNLITTKSEIDKHADLLKQAVTAGKTVASSATNWQKGADKATALDKAIAEGLKDAALEVGAAYGQAISWDQYGIWGRKLVEGTTDQFEDEQFRMINNKLVFSSDGFKTSKSVFGKFTIKDKNGDYKTYWGVLSDAVISGYIEGSEIYGGTINIGDGNFVVDAAGNMSVGGSASLGGTTVDKLNQTLNNTSDFISSNKYTIEILSDSPTAITSASDKATLTCRVYSWDTDITDEQKDSQFYWVRTSNNTDADNAWNAKHIGKKTVEITADDIYEKASFRCDVDLPD